MEFHEKLQELRKSKGLTQEELAEALYVSRTAISKWESGRGYPNIDSLKEIANYFSVSIDELLSGDKLLSIAEKENKANIANICDLLYGIVDIIAFVMIILPLYPNEIDEYIYSVNLFSYTQTTTVNLYICWILFISLILMGMVKLYLKRRNPEKMHKGLTDISVVVHIITVLYLAVTREAYAIIFAFILLIIKAFLLFKSAKLK